MSPASPRTIPFVKASACGNDFLLIDAALAPPDIAAFTRRICDRHDGVGADGVEWMSPHPSADAEIRLINADGSPAEISGNGTRCVAAYLCATQGKERISILTGAGTKLCTLTERRGDNAEFEFEIEMGKAAVQSDAALQVASGDAQGNARGSVRGTPISMGNPHFVIFVSQFAADWQAEAAEIQNSSHFPEGVNIEFVVVEGKHDIAARFFERGAGETMSSGTGSCACAVASIATGRAESPVKVHAPGGTQMVRLQDENVFLRGPARLVCRGEYFVGD
ncbi:MAG TPA: diaminopimelate epimerase [Candidatus Sulfotelmatobacter sp.]|nr:diaminopimelate epimerase [Candidatus Sulfotelmatobacter sp.]